MYKCNLQNEILTGMDPLGIDKVKGLQRLQVHDFIAFGNDNNANVSLTMQSIVYV